MVRPVTRALLICAALGLAVLASGGPYAVHVASRGCVLALAALGLHLVVGRLGQISLGHAALLGVGAYTGVQLLSWGLPSPVAGLAAVALTAAVGAVLARFAGHLVGPRIAVATLAFQVICEQVFMHGGPITGGHMGRPAPSPQDVFHLGDRAYFVICLLSLLLCLWATRAWLRRGIGPRLVALRDEPQAAEAVGIDPVRTRMQAYAVSAGLCGLAGALGVGLTDSLHPGQFTLSTSLELLVMVVVGGAKSLYGPLLGAALLVTMSAQLGAFAGQQSALMGALLIIAVLLFPKGLVGRWSPG